ncbi:MAG: ribonuclease III [Pseudomonadota bacterium]
MKLTAELQAFCARLGHTFSEPALLIEALTHPSLSSPTRANNQRMEFLGDRVLNLVLAEAVLAADPQASEGTLAPRYNLLVKKETCADVARSIDLGSVLRLGKSEMVSGGRRLDAALGDAMEAVIAAVYRDAGLEAARAVVLGLWDSRIATLEHDEKDPKSSLQEWAQSHGQPAPKYSEVSRSGPPHAPVFTVEARLSDGRFELATGRAKREAEKDAARALLERVLS